MAGSIRPMISKDFRRGLSIMSDKAPASKTRRRQVVGATRLPLQWNCPQGLGVLESRNGHRSEEDNRSPETARITQLVPFRQSQPRRPEKAGLQTERTTALRNCSSSVHQEEQPRNPHCTLESSGKEPFEGWNHRLRRLLFHSHGSPRGSALPPGTRLRQ